MSNSRWLIVLIIILTCTHGYTLRAPRPNTFSLPWDDDQMSQHNDAHEDMWNITNGRINLDITTTPKTRANNGDIWLIQTGQVVRLQYKALNRVFTAKEETD